MIGWVLSKFTAYLWPIVAAAFVALGLWGTYHRWQHHRADAAVVECKNASEVAQALATEAALKQATENQAITEQRVAVLQEKIDAKDKQLERARADAVIADAATGRLRERFAAALAEARRAAQDPGPAGSSQAAPPADLPADMFGGVLDVARRYRDAAEDALTRGELCQAQYESLGR